MDKELEEAIKTIKYYYSDGEFSLKVLKPLDIILNYIDNSIPKELIEKEIEILKMEEHYDYIDNKKVITVLQEILEEK